MWFWGVVAIGGLAGWIAVATCGPEGWDALDEACGLGGWVIVVATCGLRGWVVAVATCCLGGWVVVAVTWALRDWLAVVTTCGLGGWVAVLTCGLRGWDKVPAWGLWGWDAVRNCGLGSWDPVTTLGGWVRAVTCGLGCVAVAILALGGSGAIGIWFLCGTLVPYVLWTWPPLPTAPRLLRLLAWPLLCWAPLPRGWLCPPLPPPGAPCLLAVARAATVAVALNASSSAENIHNKMINYYFLIE